VEVLVERGVGQLRAARPAQVGPPARRRPRESSEPAGGLGVEPVLGARQAAQLFHDLAFPARDIGNQFFQYAQRALAPAVVDGLGDIHAAPAEIQRQADARAATTLAPDDPEILLLITGWFRKYPRELAATLSPAQAAQLCRALVDAPANAAY